MDRFFRIILSTGVLMFLCLSNVMTALPGLVGIINNSRRAKITYKVADGSMHEVFPEQPVYFRPIDIPDSSKADKDRLYDEALELVVSYAKDDDETMDYVVRIAQTGLTILNQPLITAIAQYGSETRSAPVPVRVTNAVNGAYIPGLSPSPWQGVLIAFEDRAVSDYEKEIPFSFALSGWATNRKEWCGQVPYFLKIKQAINGEAVFKDSKNKDTYLNVIQGQQAFGGGVLPRPKAAHLVHIYNNTDRALDIKRTLGGGKGETFLIPPQSVIPYIMEWIPVRTGRSAGLSEEWRPGIRIAVLRPQAKNLPQPIDEDLLLGAAGIRPLATTVDVDTILSEMGLSTPGSAAKIMNTDSIQKMMKPAGENTQFYASKVVYKIWVSDADNKIKIYLRDLSRADLVNQEIFSSKEPAYEDAVHPGYYSLVVTESGDIANPLKFKLTRLKALVKPCIDETK